MPQSLASMLVHLVFSTKERRAYSRTRNGAAKCTAT